MWVDRLKRSIIQLIETNPPVFYMSKANVEDNAEIMQRILSKFKSNDVTLHILLRKCEKMDKEKDRTIHEDDFEEMVQSLLGDNKLTISEMIYLETKLIKESSQQRTILHYDKLKELFNNCGSDKLEEESLPSGSIGEFLQTDACPAEIANFQKFIHLIEKYEKATGLKAKPSSNGFIIPMGPELRVSMEFYLA